MSFLKEETIDFYMFDKLTVSNESVCYYIEKMLSFLPSDVVCNYNASAFLLENDVIDTLKNEYGNYSEYEIINGDKSVIRIRNKEKTEKKTVKVCFDASPEAFYNKKNKLEKDIIFSFINKGVVFESFDGVRISPETQIGKGTVIKAGSSIYGKTVIGENCIIGSYSEIDSCTIGNDCVIDKTKMEKSVLGNNVQTGPYMHIRANSVLKDGVKLGAFVQIKNSTIDTDTHAAHLTYIGDSDVGKNVNFGCGTVTCNYDGKYKYRTKIGDNVFIGCNSNLVAPVELDNGSFVAAGSTITDKVPENSLAIARSRQTVKDDWAKQRREKGMLK